VANISVKRGIWDDTTHLFLTVISLWTTTMMISKRQNDDFLEGDGTRRVLVCDKTCETTYIIKWSILLGLFGLFFIWLFVGYWHARLRIRKGLQPLAYHRWLAPRRNAPMQNNYAYYQPNPNRAYGMQSYPEPPPMYSGDMPPTYQPPPGGPGVSQHGTKLSPQQNGFA